MLFYVYRGVIMISLENNVVFTVNPSIEFIYALNFIANKEALYKFYSDFNYTPAEKFRETAEQMKGKLSRYIQNELRFFFQWEPMKHALGKIIQSNECIESVSSFIELIEQMHENEILSYIISQALYGPNAEASIYRNKNDNMTDKVLKMISDAEDDSTIDKEKLREFAENPLEIKSRLILLMKQFYEKSYKKNESGILSELHKAKGRYENMFSNNYSYFEDEYLSVLPKANYKKLIIHISYFTQIRVWSFDIEPSNDTRWISLGMYSEYYPRKKFTEARVFNFIKILSDKKRFEIIRILSVKPHCVYELASELELTSPTICYHLNYMVDLNIVSLKRENSKTYYSLNKEAVKELLNNAHKILLSENE